MNHAYAALLKTQFPDGGTFACFEDEAEALFNDSENLFGNFSVAGKGTPSSLGSRSDAEGGSGRADRTVSTCRVEDTAQLEFVDLRESVWVNVGALLCVFLALRLATYLALRFVTLKPR